MADKEMTLRMKIAARTRDARRQIRGLAGDIRRLAPASQFANRVVSGSFRGMGRVIDASARAGSRGLTVLTASAVLLTGASLKAYSTQQALEAQLTAVSASAQEAAKDFQDTARYSGATPFALTDLVQARIILKGIGISGPRALRATSQAAAAMGRDVSDLALVVASMETEPLRRLGINLKRDGDSFVFEYRNKMGEVQEITAKGSEAAQKALLGIFETRFDGATNLLSRTLKGRVSSLKDAGFLAAASFGKGFEEGSDLSGMIGQLTGSLNELTETGKLEESGKRFGEWVRDAVVNVAATLMTARDLLDDLREGGPIAVTQFVGDLMVASAKVFAMALITGVSSATAVFEAVAKLMAASFIGEVLRMPFMEGQRNKLASQAISEISEEDALKNFGTTFGWAKTFEPGSRGSIAQVKRLPMEQQLQLATRAYNPERRAADALSKAGDTLENNTARLQAFARQEFGAVRTPSSTLGADFRERFAVNQGAAEDYLNKGREQGFIQVMHQRKVPFVRPLFGDDGSQVGVERGFETERRFEQVAGRRDEFQEGGELNGGRQVSFSVNRLNINNQSEGFESILARMVREAGPLRAGGGI